MSEKNKLISINVEDIFATACKLPYCKINRDDFLSKQLKGRVDEATLFDALKNGTVNAKISIKLLNELADDAIKLETTKATVLSTAAGMPGGIAMLGTVPGDLAQFYAHVFRIAQKLAYIYGYKEIDLDDATHNILMVFIGVMSGVGVATAALAKFASANATKIGTRIAAKPLTKYALYNITKKILSWLGVKITKASVGRVVSKVVPIVGGVVSGTMTVAMFLPMSKKLKRQLSKFAAMSPEALEKANIEADVILADYEVAKDDSA